MNGEKKNDYSENIFDRSSQGNNGSETSFDNQLEKVNIES